MYPFPNLKEIKMFIYKILIDNEIAPIAVIPPQGKR